MKKILIAITTMLIITSLMAYRKPDNTKTVFVNSNFITATVLGKTIKYNASARIEHNEKNTSPLSNYISIYAGKAFDETIAINFYSFKSKESLVVGKYDVSKLDLLRGKKGAVVCPSYSNHNDSYVATAGFVNVTYNDGKSIKGNFEFTAQKINDKKVVIKITNGSFEALFGK